MSAKFRQFQYNSFALDDRETTSGARIEDRTVASCVPIIFRKSRKNGSAQLWTEFLMTQNLRGCGIFTSKRKTRVNNLIYFVLSAF